MAEQMQFGAYSIPTYKRFSSDLAVEARLLQARGLSIDRIAVRLNVPDSWIREVLSA